MSPIYAQDSQDPQTQDPKPAAKPVAQEPKPTTEPMQEPATAVDQSARAQVPVEQPSVQPPADPPADFDEKMLRLFKARADAYEKGLVDDRDRVRREPLAPEEAMRAAIAYLPRYLQSDGGADEVRNFMAGGRVPNGWVPASGRVKSIETQDLEWQAQYGREKSPYLAAAWDYAIDPVGTVVSKALQVPTDILMSGLKHVGAVDPNASVDVRSLAYGLRTTRDELAAIDATKSIPAKVVKVGAELGGTAYGFTIGLTGKVLGLAGEAGGAAGKALFGPVGQAMGHGAGVFGAYEGLTAKPGEVLESTAKGVAAGAALGFAQKVAAIGLRQLFKTPIENLGTDEKGVMGALQEWATKARVLPERGETAAAYEKRTVDAYISAGLPGAPAMPARKLMAAAMRGGADAVGFSLLDQQFREDLIQAAWDGDKSKWESVLTKFGGNFLGAAALHMPLSSIVPWQRRQAFGKPSAEPVEAPKPATPTETPQEPAAPAAGSQEPQIPPGQPGYKPPLLLKAPEPTRAEKLTAEQDAKLAQDYTDRWDTLLNQAQTQGHWENTLGASLDNVIPLGWRPSERSVRERPEGEPAGDRAKFELPQTGMSFTIEGDVGKPSPALRESLGLPMQMPAKELVETVEKASLVSALHTKAALPGQEITVGVKGTPARGEKPAMMHRSVMGEIQQSPLQPDPVWEKVDAVPARGKDAIEPDQIQAVGALRFLTETRDDIAPQDRSLINASIEVLDTVSAANDPSVAETMAAMPKIVDAIEKGEPGAAKVLAESLTTKTPEKAMADAKAAVDSAAADAQRKLDEAHAALDAVPEADRHAGNKAFREAQRAVERAGNDLSAAMKARPKPAGTPVSGEAPAKPTRVEGPPNPESGHLDLTPEPGSPADKAIKATQATAEAGLEALEAGGKTVGKGFHTLWNAFQQSTIQKVEDLGRRAEAEIGRDMTTATKRFQTQMDTAGLMDLRRMPPSQLASVSRPEDIVSDGIGGYASVYARAMDAGMAKHFGKVENLTPEQKEVVDKGRAVTHEAGKIAEDIGIEQTDSQGKNPRPFKFDPAREVLVREPSPEWGEAMRKQSGPYWDAMMNWLGKKYGITPDEAAKPFTDSRGLTSLDATEVRRVYPVVPEFLDVNGERVRFYEGRPLQHAERLAFRSSQVLGARSVLPRFVPEPSASVVRVPGTETGAVKVTNEGDGKFTVTAHTLGTPLGLDPLPPTAQQFVDKVFNDKKNGGREAAEATANMVRAAFGLPLTRTPKMFAPGEVGYNTVRVMNGIAGLAKASALSMSAPMNLAEPLTNVAHFGISAIGHGYRETVKAIATGNFAVKHRKLVAEGFLADTKLNDPWKGDTSTETVINSLKKAGEVLTTPIRMTQDVNEMVLGNAARERLAEMKAGNGSKADANALSLLGFRGPEIDAILDGKGTEAQYERYQRNIVGELAGGKSQRSAQKSAAGNSPGFNSIVWFTNFFQARSRVVDRLVRDIGNAPDAAAKFSQVQQLTKFLAATGLGGLIGNVTRQWLTGGQTGVEDYLREQSSGNALDLTKNIGGLIGSGVLGGVGQPLADVFGAGADAALGFFGANEKGTAAREQLGKSLVRLAGPLDTVLKLAEGKGIQGALPAAKAINEGLFGLGAIALTDKNVALDNAQDSYYRWARAHRPDDFARRGGTEEQQAFRESMRKVIDRVAAGKGWSDDELINTIVEAEAVAMQNAETKRGAKIEQGAHPKAEDIYKAARESVVSSLRDRKILPEPGKFPTDQVASLEAHLGEKNLQTLKDYDAVLELLAKRVKNANLRGQVQERATK